MTCDEFHSNSNSIAQKDLFDVLAAAGAADDSRYYKGYVICDNWPHLGSMNYITVYENRMSFQ